MLLREGTDTSQGKGQLISNINACMAVVDSVRTTLVRPRSRTHRFEKKPRTAAWHPFLPPRSTPTHPHPSPPIHPQGPRGLDKLVHDDRGTTTISNDGATIMKLLDIVHPAAKSLVDIAKSQDSEVGDGTTTVVILAGEFLRECKPFVEDGVHPQNIIKHFREAAQMAIARVKSLSGVFLFLFVLMVYCISVRAIRLTSCFFSPTVSIEGKDAAEKRELLKKCAMTTLSSKLVGGEKEFFGQMCVDAVMHLDQDLLDPRMIGVKKVMGGEFLFTIFIWDSQVYSFIPYGQFD